MAERADRASRAGRRRPARGSASTSGSRAPSERTAVALDGRLRSAHGRPRAAGRRSSPSSSALAALVPFLTEHRLRRPRRRRHAALLPARARAQHRRRLGRACSTSATSPSSASAPTRTRSSSSDQFDLHWPTVADDPGRRRRVGAARPPARPAFAPPRRRLPRDRDALLRCRSSSRPDERRPDHAAVERRPDRLHRRPERDLRTSTRSSSSAVEFDARPEYFWLALGVFALVIVALSLLERLAHRPRVAGLREDPLAAELMSIPVNRMKLLAFMFGAAIAGLTGTIFAARAARRLPGRTSTSPLLITVYAMVILGGAGSLPGVVLGAVVINVSLEAAARPGRRPRLFYGAIVVAARRRRSRPWTRLAVIAGGTVASRPRRVPRVAELAAAGVDRRARSRADGSPTCSRAGCSSRRPDPTSATSPSSP